MEERESVKCSYSPVATRPIALQVHMGASPKGNRLVAFDPPPPDPSGDERLVKSHPYYARFFE